MKHLRFFILIAGLALTGIVGCKQTTSETEWAILSPDSKVKLLIRLNPDSSLIYQVFDIRGETETEIIEPSKLGIVRTDADFSRGLTFVSQEVSRLIDESYSLKIGPTTSLRDYATESVLHFATASGAKIDLVCRAYNDGVAFRYVFPETVSNVLTVSKEATSFNLPDSGKAWLQPYDTLAWWAPAYEQFFMNEVTIGTTAPTNRNGWCFPMLFNARGRWIYVSESGLDTSYCGMHLEAEAPGGEYTLRLPEADEAFNLFPQLPASTSPWIMPWRYVVFSEQLADIFASTRVYDLAAPCRLTDTSWIKPGRASWSWWSEGKSCEHYDKLTPFIDLASDMGWEYSLIDEGWQRMEGKTIEDLIGYASGKQVGILLWYDSGGRINWENFGDERQRRLFFDDSTRIPEMKRINALGAKGVKVDFFQSDKQGMIRHYFNILQDAADNRLVVNFHGCTMPRGWARTYPNLLTMEAIRGGEAYRFDAKYPETGPWHNTVIPFTRNVAGSMDYTPVTLSNSKYPHSTTYAHELALAVVFESGILHCADHYKSYGELPAFALEYLMQVPVLWDESRLIDGYPGKEVYVARRKGKVWYIAGLNGEMTDKETALNLDFISTPATFSLIEDGKTATELISRNGTIAVGESVRIKMLPAGGFCGRIIMK